MKNGKFRIIFFSFVILIFLGCATKTEPIFMSVNSPKLKFADQGFIKKGLGYKEIVIYKDGIEPVRFVIKNSYICIQNQCFDKKSFMKEYKINYSPDFFDKILDKKTLDFGTIVKTKNGFIEKDKTRFYLVNKNKVLFKDRQNHIIIFIRYLKDIN